MAARDNLALRAAYGSSTLQDNTRGHLDPNADILSKIQQWQTLPDDMRFIAGTNGGLTGVEALSGAFVDPNTGWTYQSQGENAGRKQFWAMNPEELAKARANPGYRAKVGVYDTDTGQFLYEQDATSKADVNRGTKLGLLAVGGMFAAGAAGALGGAAGAGGSSGGAAMGAGAGGTAGTMGPITAAEAAAQAGLLQAELAPYLASGAAGGAAGGATGSMMGPPTEAAAAAQSSALQAELAPYLAKGAAGGLTTKAMMDAAAKYGPTAVSLASGIAGGYSGDEKQTVKRDLPDWIKPYVLGTDQQPGLLQLTRDTYTQNQPALLESVQRLRNSAAGLLATPVRGNGYGLLNKGK